MSYLKLTISHFHLFFQNCYRISTTGASEYKLNDKVVTYTAYNAALIKQSQMEKVTLSTREARNASNRILEAHSRAHRDDREVVGE